MPAAARWASLPLAFPLSGCIGGIFGLLVAIGLLYGERNSCCFFTIGIKARYLAAIYALIAIAMLFGEQRMYAFAQLGGALGGLLYIRLAPRRGFDSGLSESWYGLRNRYYRWKRRRASRKFEVYMRSQGRPCALTARARQSMTTRTTRSAGTERRDIANQSMCCRQFTGHDSRPDLAPQ